MLYKPGCVKFKKFSPSSAPLSDREAHPDSNISSGLLLTSGHLQVILASSAFSNHVNYFWAVSFIWSVRVTERAYLKTVVIWKNFLGQIVWGYVRADIQLSCNTYKCLWWKSSQVWNLCPCNTLSQLLMMWVFSLSKLSSLHHSWNCFHPRFPS